MNPTTLSEFRIMYLVDRKMNWCYITAYTFKEAIDFFETLKDHNFIYLKIEKKIFMTKYKKERIEYYQRLKNAKENRLIPFTFEVDD